MYICLSVYIFLFVLLSDHNKSYLIIEMYLLYAVDPNVADAVE